MPRPVVVYSNSPTAGTGYGQQTSQLALRLKRAGHEVFIASNFGHEGSIAEWRGMKVLPRGFDMYSNDVVAAYWELACHETGQEALAITLFDVWVFQGPSWDRIPRVLSWVPIDHAPVPKKVAEWLAKDNVTPVAMSQFGASELEKVGIDHRYAPHALERTFQPTKFVERPNGERITGRQLLGFDEDDFVIFMNSANKGQVPARKSWDTNFMAVSIFMEDHPDARLFLHTERDGAMGGIHLPALLNSVGIPPEKVRFTEPFSYRMGLPQEALAAMNTASDVVLTVSLGEGFGIPTIEAQACGTRVVTSSWSASRELVGDGWTVVGQPSWDPMQSAWWMVPNVGSTIDALVSAYEAPRGRSDKAIAFAADYEADLVYDTYWKPILAEFE